MQESNVYSPEELKVLFENKKDSILRKNTVTSIVSVDTDEEDDNN